MRSKKIIGTLVLGLILFSSCEKTFNTIVELDIDHTPLITVNSANTVTKDSLLALIKGSKGVTDTGICPTLTNATVKLFEDGNQVSQLQYDPQTELFGSAFNNFKAGKTYKLTVDAPSYASVEAEEVMPSPLDGLSYTINRNARQLAVGGDPKMWFDELKISFNDNPSNHDYYCIKITYQPEALYDRSNEVYFYGFRLFSQDADIDQENSDPLDPQYGIFNGRIYFTDNNFNGKKKDLTILIATGNSSPDPFPNNIVYYMAVDHLTENAYRFEKTTKLYWDNEGNPFSEPVQITQNVKQGVGNFRLKNRWIDSLEN